MEPQRQLKTGQIKAPRPDWYSSAHSQDSYLNPLLKLNIPSNFAVNHYSGIALMGRVNAIDRNIEA